METKIIALDDDPTGSQTVHSCLLLTRWDTATLREALTDSAPIFFVLTNTRGMGAGQAASVTHEVCVNLREALDSLEERSINPLLVSRSDSTLRGHYPVETDAISKDLGPFDAHFLVPAFLEAGRITRESIHYVVQDGVATPAHETEFARDPVFGYSHSYLPDYVEEKTRGRIRASEVERFVLDDIRSGILDRLTGLTGNACGVIDAEKQSDLDLFAADLLAAASQGKRFLLRSAASVLTSLARLPAQPVAPEEMGRFTRGTAGAVVVGSFVQKTTEQLELLLAEEGTAGVEVEVASLPGDPQQTIEDAIKEATAAHESGLTPVIYTSRQVRQFASKEAQLEFGGEVSAALVEIVSRLPPTIGYLISKGGITSNDVLKAGLDLRVSRLLGQILTGCSVVKCPDDHPRFPQMPVVIFPGNVGDRNSLAEAYRRLSAPASADV